MNKLNDFLGKYGKVINLAIILIFLVASMVSCARKHVSPRYWDVSQQKYRKPDIMNNEGPFNKN